MICSKKHAPKWLAFFAMLLLPAQLAAAHPTSGGTYAYGRAELGPWWGFTAGWGFVIGKTASCAAMALTFAAYAAPTIAGPGPLFVTTSV